MSKPRQRELCLTPPLVGQAFSGRFEVATKPPTEHTLGDLILAVFNKGNRTETHPYERGGFNRMFFADYSPSWAPNVQAEVLFRVIGGVAMPHEVTFTNLDLETQTAESTLFVENRFDDPRGLVTETQPFSRINVDGKNFLLLPGQVEEAQLYVASATETYFTENRN